MSCTLGKFLRLERQSRKSGGPRKILVYQCSIDGCNSEIKVRTGGQGRCTGMCMSHAQRKRPFESIYNGLFNDHRELSITLTYEEFVKFTDIKNCHYCKKNIGWLEYATVNGQFSSQARYLDRKDSDAGYSKENCVVCCTVCNKLKGNRFTYEEFLLLAPSLEQIEASRAKEKPL